MRLSVKRYLAIASIVNLTALLSRPLVSTSFNVIIAFFEIYIMQSMIERQSTVTLLMDVNYYVDWIHSFLVVLIFVLVNWLIQLVNGIIASTVKVISLL